MPSSAFVHLLALLAHSGSRLSDVVAELPSVHVVHREVPTPFEQKGLVMRTVLERAAVPTKWCSSTASRLVDANGWTLVVPDPEEPLTHVDGRRRDAADARRGRSRWQNRWR